MKKIYFYYSFVLICSLFSLLLPTFNISAKAALPEYIDIATTSFLSASAGTNTDPYLISSATELAGIAKEVYNGNKFENKYFELTCDIDLGERNWTPIGSIDYQFKGNFNGNNFNISNLNIINKSRSYSLLGLFGYIGYSSLENIVLFNPKIDDNIETNLVVGCVAARADNLSVFRNISVYNAQIHVLSANTLGTVSGTVNNMDVSHIYTSGDITIYGSGLVDDFDSYIGGVFGYATDGTKIYEVCNETNIDFRFDKTNSYIGGILGVNYYHHQNMNIENSFNKGNIKSIGGYIFGITYRINVKNTYNIGILNINDGHLYGIAAPEGMGEIINSYNNPSKLGLLAKLNSDVFSQSDKINNGYPFLKWRYHETSI